jgi:hypothetical protein
MTQEQQMPSSTRFTVHVEGHGVTYWDNIHDAITYAQRAVYAGVTNTTRALDDLKAGRFAEWSYGFSAVRIYPPQNSLSPQPEQEPQRWAVFCAGCRKEWSVPYQHPGKSVCAECESKLKAQPEQEPVAWEYKALYIPNPQFDDGMRVTRDLRVAQVNAEPGTIRPLSYTTPPQRKPLTDELLEKGRDQTFSINNPFCPCDSKTFRKVARWVEAAHGIKEVA